MTKLQHILHALIYPAPDLPGEWIAHCLELDLVSQGTGQAGALEMLAEAITMIAAENVSRGRFPLDFRSAPDEDWHRLENAEQLVTRIISLPTDDVSIVPAVANAS